jgi:hypothetical protein
MTLSRAAPKAQTATQSRIDRIRITVANALAGWWRKQRALADADIEREIARSFPEPLRLPEPSGKAQIADRVAGKCSP